MLRFTEEQFRLFNEQKGRKKKKADIVRQPAIQISPHAIALAALAKNPDLLQGNQEHFEQVIIFDYYERHDPFVYDHLHATPNGGHRTKAAAGKMKAEGQKKGYPDMSLDIRRGAYGGMRIELKAPNGKGPTEEQKVWLNRLVAQGYYCVLCYGADQVIKAIREYCNLNKNQHIEQHLNDSKWKAL